MTTERSGMSLETVRDRLYGISRAEETISRVGCRELAEAIDAQLSRDAGVNAVAFSTVSAVVKALSRVGHAAPESQEEQAARFESLVIDLCREVDGRYDRSTTSVSEVDAIGLIDGLNMMASSSDSTGHDSESEFLRCCAHAFRQSFAARHAAVPDEFVYKYRADGSEPNMDYIRGWNACREAMLAQRDGV
ncbi:hypothetical protein ACN9MB_13345 [Dyella kyungheensis]|uniref:hypothetical protein n=1 Tax=Dyella kyungheensis TaxID=1242174 RepID=UPI003CE74AB7